MPYLLLALGVLIGAFALYRFFLNATPRQIAALGFAVVTGVLALALLVLALTGRLPAAIAIVAALWPVAIAWWRHKAGKSAGRTQDNATKSAGGPDPQEVMSRAEALDILGLPETAGPQDVRNAHRALMKKLHPDHDGTQGLARQLNMARDILLEDKPD